MIPCPVSFRPLVEERVAAYVHTNECIFVFQPSVLSSSPFAQSINHQTPASVDVFTTSLIMSFSLFVIRLSCSVSRLSYVLHLCFMILSMAPLSRPLLFPPQDERPNVRTADRTEEDNICTCICACGKQNSVWSVFHRISKVSFKPGARPRRCTAIQSLLRHGSSPQLLIPIGRGTARQSMYTASTTIPLV